MYKSYIFKRFSTIFTALFYPYIAHERTAQNLDFVSSLIALRSFSYWASLLPKSRFAQERRAIERFQRAMCPALQLNNKILWIVTSSATHLQCNTFAKTKYTETVLLSEVNEVSLYLQVTNLTYPPEFFFLLPEKRNAI